MMLVPGWLCMPVSEDTENQGYKYIFVQMHCTITILRKSILQ
jgi:hypothetical protein